MDVVDSPLLSALALKPTARTPLWVMRQAGRYLPEYRELRKEAGSFLKLCKTPEMACAATMQPINRFKLDAAIVFSDILVIPDALGLGLGFAEGEGPFFERPVRNEQDVAKLGQLDVSALDYQHEAIRMVRASLADDIPLIGFAGGPFTLACYMVDGRGGEFWETRRMMHERFDLFQRILQLNTEAVARCLVAQATAGADVLMVFESWASLVPLQLGQTCLIDPLARIISSLREAGIDQPVIAFLRNASELASLAAATGVAGLGVDWRTDLAKLSAQLGAKVALQGNLDPAVLLTNPEAVRSKVREVLDSYQAASGHIFNLGHGIDRRTPVENMEALVAAVAEFSTS